MNIIENYSLKAYNTFGIDCVARHFCDVNSNDDLQQLFEMFSGLKTEHFVLGGGSNVLFTRDLNLLVLKINTKGIEVLKEDDDNLLVRAQAGEHWDDFVGYCVDRGWGGLENLSLIPGQVGSSPIQNIGAYGVELNDFFYELEAVEKESGQIKTFSNADCRFGYRDSFFKREGRDNYIITSVTFRLTKCNHQISNSYGGIQKGLEAMGVQVPSISDVREAVINIRNSKLPDPKIIGNAGSFFKNPVVGRDVFNSLKEKYLDLVAFETNGQYKLAAGWLIDKAGWKGYRDGDAGVHSKQALVLVNYGNASGNDILALAKKIQESVIEKFGVELEPEVNVF